MKTLNLFPTQIYQANAHASSKRKALTKDLLEEAYLHRDLDPVGKKWSKENYAHGYTSYSSVTDLPARSSQYLELRNWIDGEVRKFSRILELDLAGGRLEMTSCWVNIMGKGCYHAYHFHPLSTISGTFYLQVPKSSGTFKMEDPRAAHFMASPPRKTGAKIQNRRYFEFSPKEGDLLLFESWLKHEVTQNHSSEDRVSVSFNYDWIQG
jgi:uncharacterized protein (TIGR02466 family)